jgi:hypothetical protein
LLKLFYTLLTDPLGLPIAPLWEYVILLIVGEIVHEIAWSTSPGGTFGSLIYWVTKLIAFVAIWAVLYAIIAVAQFVIAHWIWFAIGAAIIIAVAIAFATWNRKHKPAVF